MMGGLTPPDVFMNLCLEHFTVIDSDGEARNNPIDAARVVAVQGAGAVDKHEVGRVAQGGGACPIPIRFTVFIILASFRFSLQTIKQNIIFSEMIIVAC